MSSLKQRQTSLCRSVNLRLGCYGVLVTVTWQLSGSLPRRSLSPHGGMFNAFTPPRRLFSSSSRAGNSVGSGQPVTVERRGGAVIPPGNGSHIASFLSPCNRLSPAQFAHTRFIYEHDSAPVRALFDSHLCPHHHGECPKLCPGLN